MITHPRVYLDIYVSGRKGDYERGLVAPKFYDFIKTLEMRGHEKHGKSGKVKPARISDLSPEQLKAFLESPSAVEKIIDSKKKGNSE
ncbi:MAG: hypothetical protein ABIJ27_02265 [Candidatus Omnitrophota bacterium]